MNRISRIVGMVMTGLIVYSMLGTMTFRMAEAKWADGNNSIIFCKYDVRGDRWCRVGEMHAGAVTAGFVWPIGLPIVIGIVAGGKITGTESALAKPPVKP